jgi:hypothetical protein
VTVKATLHRKVGIWALGTLAAIVLAGCGGGEGTGTAAEPELGGGGDAEAPASVTIQEGGVTVTIDDLDTVSFITIESDRAPGPAAIRTGSCESVGEVVVDLGAISNLLSAEVQVKFEELTGGGHVLTIGDSFCVELQPA